MPLRIHITGLCLLLFSISLAAGQGTSAPQGSLDNGLLGARQEIDAQIESGKIHSYWINLRASQYVNIIVTEEGTNVVAILLGPTGN